MTSERRAVFTLAAAQALYQTCPVLVVTVGGLAGALLAPRPGLATLPIACMALGTLATTVPASLLMGRVGRRPGFLLGAVLGICGGGVAAIGLAAGSFVLLCTGILLIGAYIGFAQFYRFAAAEVAGSDFRSRAISYVMAGGVFAAVAGPNLGAWSRDAVAGAAYAGSFLAVSVLSVIAVVVLATVRLPPPSRAAADGLPARPLPDIMRQPRFLAAVVGAASGASIMTLAMTATPISMVAHGHAISDAAFVIQWHVLGMFVPSFFTGWLVKRLGLKVMMLAGIGALLLHVGFALSGQEMLHYLSGLVLLGIGWNFLYIGGSTLLTETYRPSERSRVQALNDFLIVGLGAAASLSAGALAEAFGWRGLNLAALTLLLVAGAIVAWGASPRTSTAN